jgi:hypothetical protein
MGIKDFTKVFSPDKEIKYKDLKGCNVVIDGMIEICRAVLGMNKINALTDPQGMPTSHINTILAIILKLKESGARQYWIFDKKNSDENPHNPLKVIELKKRKENKDRSKEKLKRAREKLDNFDSDEELFSDSDEEKESKESIQHNIDKYEKASFTLSEFYVDDIKFLLDCFGVPWMESPEGYESEQMAAFMTHKEFTEEIGMPVMDYVLTTDADALLFGATRIIKRDLRKKKMFLYELSTILNTMSLDDLIKTGIVLQCDFAPKTKGIGPKTVLKKLNTITLTEDQINAFHLFKRGYPEKDSYKWVNVAHEQFTEVNVEDMLYWLEKIKGFNRNRIEKRLAKLGLTNLD